jgi:hypothetical protein
MDLGWSEGRDVQIDKGWGAKSAPDFEGGCLSHGFFSSWAGSFSSGPSSLSALSKQPNSCAATALRQINAPRLSQQTISKYLQVHGDSQITTLE